MLIRDANRTRPCECERKATEVRIVQNGQETVRIAADLKPLDFYHLERGSTWSDSSFVTKNTRKTALCVFTRQSKRIRVTQGRVRNFYTDFTCLWGINNYIFNG